MFYSEIELCFCIDFVQRSTQWNLEPIICTWLISGTPVPTCEYYIVLACDMHTLRDKKKPKSKMRHYIFTYILYIYLYSTVEKFRGPGVQLSWMVNQSLPFHWFNFCRHAHSHPLCTVCVQSSFTVRRLSTKNSIIGPLENFPLYSSLLMSTFLAVN